MLAFFFSLSSGTTRRGMPQREGRVTLWLLARTFPGFSRGSGGLSEGLFPWF